MLGKGAQNALAREALEQKFRDRLYADTPQRSVLTRQVKRRMARIVAKRTRKP
jgi:hypothetical protein